jgi:hypothetical protein
LGERAWGQGGRAMRMMSGWDLDRTVQQTLVDGMYAELIVLRGDGTYRLCRTPEQMMASRSGCTRALGRLLRDLQEGKEGHGDEQPPARA